MWPPGWYRFCRLLFRFGLGNAGMSTPNFWCSGLDVDLCFGRLLEVTFYFRNFFPQSGFCGFRHSVWQYEEKFWFDQWRSCLEHGNCIFGHPREPLLHLRRQVSYYICSRVRSKKRTFLFIPTATLYSGLSNNRVYTEHGNLVHFPLCTILFDSVLAILLYKVRCARSMSAPKIPLYTFIWWCTIIR